MLEDLPILALERMCEYLAAEDDKQRRSIQALSLTSKACNAASAKERFRSISIHLTFQEGKFHWDLASLNAFIHAGNNQGHIRRIKVDGNLLRTYGDEGWDPETVESKPTEDTWRSLKILLLACHGLTDLVWATSHQIPRSLLDAVQLHPRHPRLHVEEFQMWSLCQKREMLQEVDPDDYALASCSNLHRIVTVSEGLTSDGLIDYQGEAILEIVELLSPYLEEVDIHYRLAGNSPQLLEAIRSERPKWEGFLRGNKPESVVHSKDGSVKLRGKLKTLTIRGSSGLFLERLQLWVRSTDFAVLICLNIRSTIYVEALEKLIDFARNGLLCNLKQLSITGAMKTSDRTLCPTLIERLLSLLNPMEALALREAISASAFAHSKTSLRKLDMSVQFSLGQLVELRDAFPCIEDLQICIQRTQGDEQEVARYETLGSFPRITRLVLMMDYALPAAAMDPKLATPRDFQLYAMQTSLRNCAMDQTLARQIFRVILHANREARPNIIPTFTDLEIRCNSTCHHWQEDDFDIFRRSVALEWVCERRHADVNSDEAWVTELASDEKNWNLGRLKDYIAEGWKYCDDDKLFRPVWEANWPNAKGEVKWFDVWHGFPLQSRWTTV